MSQKQVKLTASSIPSAVLSHAFSFLDWTVILVSINLVCWAWNKTQNIRDVLKKVQKRDLERVLSKFAPHGVKEIYVVGRCCWACVLKRLCCQLERCSQLRHLALELESSNDGQTLKLNKELWTVTNRLESLELINDCSRNTFDLEPADQLRRLKLVNFDLRLCPEGFFSSFKLDDLVLESVELDSDQVQEIARNHLIKSLGFVWCSRTVVTEFLARLRHPYRALRVQCYWFQVKEKLNCSLMTDYLINQAEKLEELCFTLPVSTFLLAGLLRQWATLKVLELGDVPMEAFPLFPALVNLELLRLEYYDSRLDFTGNGFSSPGSDSSCTFRSLAESVHVVSYLRANKKLRDLKLCQVPDLRGEDLEKLCPQLPCLEKLESSPFPLEIKERLLVSCPNIRIRFVQGNRPFASKLNKE